MDLVLCFIDPLSQSIKYASAQGIGFLGKLTFLHILNRARRSIGDGISAVFEVIDEVGEKLVLTSDGFKDQFEEMSSNKYGCRRLRQWLEWNHSLCG